MAIDKLRLFFKRAQKKDQELTERILGNSPFHCAFLARRSLRSAIKAASGYAVGRMLDAGCGMKPYEKSFTGGVDRYIGMEYSPDSGYLGNKADISGDIKRMPFKRSFFDSILCTEVLEHVDAPDVAVKELYRVIKSGGRVIITAPFIYPVHGGKVDYFRFSQAGLVSLLERHGFNILEKKKICGSITTLGLLFNIHLHEECFVRNKFFYPLSIPLRPAILAVIFLVNVMAVALEKIVRIDSAMHFNNLIVAEAAGKA